MGSVEYRLATVSDIESLLRLRVLMQKEVNSVADDAVPARFLEQARAYFVESLGNGTYVSAVAIADGEMVAANGVVFYRKAPTITGGTGIFGHVSNVYTEAAWRRQGIATALMNLVVEEARARGAERLHLGALAVGKHVYEAVGFKPVRFEAMELRLI